MDWEIQKSDSFEKGKDSMGRVNERKAGFINSEAARQGRVETLP